MDRRHVPPRSVISRFRRWLVDDVAMLRRLRDDLLGALGMELHRSLGLAGNSSRIGRERRRKLFVCVSPPHCGISRFGTVRLCWAVQFLVDRFPPCRLRSTLSRDGR